MSVRRKLFYTLVVVAGLFSAGLLYLWAAEQRDVAMLEQRRQRERMEQMDRLLKTWMSGLENLVGTYSGLPSIVAATKDGNRVALEAELPESSAGNLTADALWVVRADGSTLATRNRSYSSELQEIPVSKPKLMEMLAGGKRSHFFVKAADGILEVSGAAIPARRSVESGAAPQGFLFGGRLWRDAEVSEISSLSGNSVRIVDAGYSEKQLSLPAGESAFTRPLPGVDGQPVARLLVRQDSPLLRTVGNLRRRIAVWALLFAVALLGAVWVALRHGVFRPLRSLTQSLRTEHSSPVRTLERDRTEIGEIARMITTFFEQRDALLKEIRDRRQQEKTVRDREEHIRQTEKMDAISRLAAGVAHDLNNLLTTIMGYATLLLEEFHDRPRTRQDVEQIADAADRAAGLLRRLTAFGRKGAPQAKAIDMNGIVQAMSDRLHQLAAGKVELRIALEAAQSWVRIEREQAEQLIQQLVQNACDAMPQGGNVTISTANTLIPETTRHNGMELPAGSYVTLQVTDTGVGMDEATRERMFEPFFTTDRNGKKAGLGLTMVYGIVRQSGGAIAVNSEEGAGSTILVHLPMIPAAERGTDLQAETGLAPTSQPGQQR